MQQDYPGSESGSSVCPKNIVYTSSSLTSDFSQARVGNLATHGLASNARVHLCAYLCLPLYILLLDISTLLRGHSKPRDGINASLGIFSHLAAAGGAENIDDIGAAMDIDQPVVKHKRVVSRAAG